MLRTVITLSIFLSLFAWNTAIADTTFSGEISGNVIWTKANGPYVVNYTSIPTGSSLTIESGTVIKVADDSYPFIVDGSLTIGSEGEEQVIITSIKDDSVGGDTNSDGSETTPQAGDWRTIIMNAGARATITHTTITYGGATPYNPWTGGHFLYPLIENNGGILTIDHADLAQSGYYGVLQNSGTTTITNSTFSTISKWGVYNAQGYLNVASTTFDTMERGIALTAGALELRGSTFTHIASYAVSIEGYPTTLLNHGGNSGTGGLFLSHSISGMQTLPKDGLTYILSYLSVPSDSSLTIMPGAIIKVFSGSGPFSVDGTLTVGSIASDEQVIITSIVDDTVGGDTNGDGTATPPSSENWRSIGLNPGSHTTISNTTIRYGGASPYNPWTGGADWLPVIRKNGGTLNMDNVTMTNNGNFALLQYTGDTTITHSEIARTSRYGIFLVDGTLSITDSSIHDNATYGVFNGTQHIIDATNNWWGSASGPTHASNPGGTGDKVSDYVDYGNWTGSDPTQGCTINCYSNVLFLPGLQASRLYRPNTNHSCDYTENNTLISPDECRLWEPQNDILTQYIGLDEGVSIWDDVYTRDVLDSAYGSTNIYATFIERMNTMKGNGVIRDWGATPYDWRLSLADILDHGNDRDGNIHYSGIDRATTTPFIMQELRRLAATSKTGKVTIIAHSNGGLVAKALLARLGDADAATLVDTVIFVASPQTGTPQAIGALLHGFKQDIPSDVWYLPDGVFFSAEAARILAHDMPGAYQLLPSAQYFDDVQTPVATFVNASPILNAAYGRYGSLLNTSIELTDFILGNEGSRVMPNVYDLVTPNIGSSRLLADAAATHTLIDSWHAPETIKIIQIAGWGVETVSGIAYTQKKRGDTYTWKYTPILKEDGDGTVVVPSALAMDAAGNVERLWVNLDEYNGLSGIIFGGVTHANILEVPNLLDFITDTITQTPTPLSGYTYISTTTPPSTSSKKLRYFLHSPLALNLYDDQGNHSGIATSTGVTENRIPGAYYREFGEVKYITVSASTTLHLVLNGEATGSFSLEVQEVIGDTIVATTTFVDIPSSTSTIVTMDFTDGTIANASPLRIDFDGDSVVEHSLPPQVGAEVTMPKPKLVVTVDDKTIILGSALPPFTATLSGFVDGDTAATSVTGIPGCTTTATLSSPVGVYSIICARGSLASEKYDFGTFATGTLTIIYKWDGFQQPINDTVYNPTQSLSVFKGGSTVPVKFQLKNASGIPAQSSTSPIWLMPQRGSTMSAFIDESTYSGAGTSGSTYRYDEAEQQYVYNWSTKGLAAGYWYRIYAKLEDGTIQSVIVGIR